VALAGNRVFVAPDARSVSAAAVADGLVGRSRVSAFAREPLPADALSVSPSAGNLRRPEEVREAIGRALRAIGHATGRVRLVLPDGLARLVLLDLPADADAREYARFRLAPSLPWPVADAIVDVLPLGRGRVVGAAVRRGAVAEYEQALAAAGLAVESVSLAPLLALTTLAGRGPRDALHVLLGDAAATLVLVRGGRVSAVRSRRRDRSAGECGRLSMEATRTARIVGDVAVAPRILWVGSDAAALQEESGRDDGPRSAAGAAWLPGALA